MFFVNMIESSAYRNSVTTEETAASLGKISLLLRWIQDNLPCGPVPLLSQAAYTIAISTVDGNPISLKGLISSLGCSEAGLRKPLQRLLDEGWVVIERDPSDQRVRRLLATGKLLSTLDALANRITDPEACVEPASQLSHSASSGFG